MIEKKSRRGFMKMLALALPGILFLGKSYNDTQPETKKLKEADFYKKNKLAG